MGEGTGRLPGGRTPDFPDRKQPAHHPVQCRLNVPPIVFVTVCTQDRKPILCAQDVHRLLLCSWKQANAWHVGRYVLMPGHMHLFCAPNDSPRADLGRWVHYWKSIASRAWPRVADQPVWQRSFWDTQMRKSESYEEKWDYVRANPVRKGLVTAPDAWPYQGEVDVLYW